jgi:hypothetical protein
MRPEVFNTPCSGFRTQHFWGFPSCPAGCAVALRSCGDVATHSFCPHVRPQSDRMRDIQVHTRTRHFQCIFNSQLHFQCHSRQFQSLPPVAKFQLQQVKICCSKFFPASESFHHFAELVTQLHMRQWLRVRSPYCEHGRAGASTAAVRCHSTSVTCRHATKSSRRGFASVENWYDHSIAVASLPSSRAEYATHFWG